LGHGDDKLGLIHIRHPSRIDLVGAALLLYRNAMEFSATTWKEGDVYVSQCLTVDIARCGETGAEALENLKEALILYFEPVDQLY